MQICYNGIVERVKVKAMKEYLDKRIKELEKEKDELLDKMTTWNERVYRNEYLATMKVLDELKELKKRGDEENELYHN